MPPLTPDWKKYEELAAQMQREMSPGATVTTNVRLPGRRSQTQRQIDILIEQDVTPYKIRIAIDCKDYAEPVDVKDVEAVIGLVDDIGANKGAIIAANGFTNAAKKRGADAGLDLYRLIDLSSHKWGGYVTIPAVVRDWKLGQSQFGLSWTGRGSFPTSDPHHFPVFRSDGSFIEYASNLILDRWSDGSIPHKVGEHCGLALTKEATFLKGSLGLFEAKIEFRCKVSQVLHFGQLKLTELRGLRDEVSADVITNGFTTEAISFERVGHEWQKIESIDQLAVKPLVTLNVSSTYPRYVPPIPDSKP